MLSCKRPVAVFAEILFKSDRNLFSLGASGYFQTPRQCNRNIPVDVNVQGNPVPVSLLACIRFVFIRFLFSFSHTRHDTPKIPCFNKSICYFKLRQYCNSNFKKIIEMTQSVLTHIYIIGNLSITTRITALTGVTNNDHRGREQSTLQGADC